MLTAFVNINSSAQVRVTFDVVSAETGSEEGAPVSAGPNPIAPEIKELAWGAGSFIVFLFFMRLFLVPKVRKGMASRFESRQPPTHNERHLALRHRVLLMHTHDLPGSIRID